MKKKLIALTLSFALLSTTTAFAFYDRTTGDLSIPSGTIHCSLEGNEGYGTATTDLDRSAYGNSKNAYATAYVEGCSGSYTVLKANKGTGNRSNPYHASGHVSDITATEYHSSHSTDVEAYGYNYKGMLLRVK